MGASLRQRHALLPLLAAALLLRLGAAEGPASEVKDRSDAFHGYSEKDGAKKATKGCRDTQSSCDDWAKKGECEKNPGFMDGACPVSCKQCTPPELNVEQYVGQMLVLDTAMGQIRIRMLFDNAPRTCALIMDLAGAEGHGEGSNFYRNEAVPPAGSSGPPYGLLQGGFQGLLKAPPPEQNHPGFVPKYGFVAMIQGGDFYISTMDHSDWGSAHTVWGHVLDMDVVEKIVNESEFDENKHPTYGTVMRLMKHHVKFSLRSVKDESAGPEAEL